MDISKDDYGYWVAENPNEFGVRSLMHYKNHVKSGSEHIPTFTDKIVVGLCDEVTALRQQVKILLEQQDRLISKVDKDAEQLALLREDLEVAGDAINLLWVSHHANRADSALDTINKALSTPFTPSDLNAYVEAHSHKPDYFGTEDEHFADSLEALAEQFLNSYNAGDEIEVHYTKDLGSELYVYGFDVNGKPTLTPITNRKAE